MKNKAAVDVETEMTALRNQTGRQKKTLRIWATPSTSVKSFQGRWNAKQSIMNQQLDSSNSNDALIQQQS